MQKHHHDIPERVFMNALLKHTGIALLILIPLAAYSAAHAEPMAVEVLQSLIQATVTGL